MHMISFEDFRKAELRVVKIISAERVPGSEKLLKLEVDFGNDPSADSERGRRQIIAGIGKKYDPEFLIGKEIVIVANLEPRSIMGLESQGMLLAADGGEGPVLLVPDKEVPPGSAIR
ncbi:MAG: methionine--tRNA ligase [Candidatus Sungbacteria bacterium RIFCSPLOWO2_01_FULL_47_10]|uniref:Methionine--tRNA ligase n=1 Tax=Candidatus Sungbacteria bacterium RIFCSPLOWO2_01_FULL_47_10 TaxID=1802276 RepID=A0A1G2L0D3_9BACT|nr:MAG: methionine--tRNA ligase [Candidatus Sungbacteria bacterium RIFCSPLOWO2_01_FULL_47_10]